LLAIDTARRIIEFAQEKKGKQIVLMEISRLASFADYFVIISGDSSVQIKAIADHIEGEMKKAGERLYQKEGYQYLNWVLLDYVDVVVHIFNHEARQFYGIERLWADAKMDFIRDEAV
jgi:ribosome-associated protein